MWGLIRCHLDEEKIISKTIKYHPILVDAYAQWLVINSGRKDYLDTKIMAGNLKDRVENLSVTSSSAIKSISKLKAVVAAANNAAYEAASKVRSLKKLSSRNSGVQVSCAPMWRALSEETDGGETIGVSEEGGKLRVSRKGW